MKDKLLDLIYEYASECEWAGYYNGLNEYDPLAIRAQDRRRRAKESVISFVEKLNIKEE